MALAASWGEGGYVLGALLVERFAHHATCVSNEFLAGRCSLTRLVDAFDRLSRFQDWTEMRDDEIATSGSAVKGLLKPWLSRDPLAWPPALVGPISRIAMRHGMTCRAAGRPPLDDTPQLGALAPKIVQLSRHADLDTLEALKYYLEMLGSAAGFDASAAMAVLVDAMVAWFQPALDAIEEDLTTKTQKWSRVIREEWLAAYAHSARFGRVWPLERRKLACLHTGGVARRILPDGDCRHLMRYLRHILTTLVLVAPREKRHWWAFAKVYKVFALSIETWPFRCDPWWNVHRFRIFSGGWFYHDVQLLFCSYTTWFARFCTAAAAYDAIEMLSHHRMLPIRHLKLIPALAHLESNELLRCVAEVAHEELIEGMEEEDLTDDEDPFA